MSTILIVDDEAHIRELIDLYLRGAGYGVLAAREGEGALRLARTAKPDLMILDLMLPKVDGLEVCRRLRQEGGDLPIIILTARDDDVDRIVGLELGADDYMTKPFNPRELVARVKAVLRRSDRRPAVVTLRLGDVTLDPEAREARVGERRLALRTKEFDLLAHLMAHANAALSREQLLEHVWDSAFYGDTRTVDVHVARLRDKLKGSQLAIETVWGIGYRLVMP
jgi:two-component system alkaline phosphatase synthesis response regulator PhoP